MLILTATLLMAQVNKRGDHHCTQYTQTQLPMPV